MVVGCCIFTMNAYFNIARARNNSEHIPRLGEVFLYEIKHEVWDTRIGDGKTMAKDLPSYYDIYSRIQKIEQEIKNIKNNIC